MITAERLRKLFLYRKRTGLFVRKIARGPWRVGSTAGWLNKATGYWRIRVDGKNYQASRLAWLYVNGHWPPRDIDHRDRDGTNIKWINLRLATESQNLANSKIRKTNTAGVKGVHRRKDRWRAQITINGVKIQLGTFKTKGEAGEAYARRLRQEFGEYARV